MKALVICLWLLIICWIGVSIYVVYNSKIVNETKIQQIERQIERQIEVREIESYEDWGCLIYSDEDKCN